MTLKKREGKYFPYSLKNIFNFPFFTLPAHSAFRGGILNYDLEFLVFAWFVVKNRGTDPAYNSSSRPSTETNWRLSQLAEGWREHGACQKPWRLIHRIIEYFTVPDDNVLDLCSGNGTTALTCFLSNRICASLESDQVQFLMMPKRLVEAQARVREATDERSHRACLAAVEEL